MADEVKVPIAGKMDKKVVIIGGVVVVAAGYYFYRKQQAASQSAAAAAQTAANTTTAGDTGTTIDPQTGYPYGSPEDQAALASMSFGLLPTQFGQFGGGGSNIGQNISGPGGFTNNAQWAQAAEAAMGSNGADAIAAAFGKYLTGQPVSADQQTSIQQAIAIEGLPPVPGPSGFPPSINLQSGGPPPPTGGVSVRATARFDNVTATWKAVTGATGYTVTLTTHQGANVVASQSTTRTSITFNNLPQKTGYAVHVTANPGGQTGTAYTATK